MVTVRNVKLGRKFVFRNEPGVYKKTAADKAKCIFGPEGILGVEIEVNPDAKVFSIDAVPDEPRVEATQGEAPAASRQVTVIFEGDKDEPILQQTVSEYEAMVLARTDVISVKTGPRKKESFVIGDTGYDMEEGILYLEVASRHVLAKKG